MFENEALAGLKKGLGGEGDGRLASLTLPGISRPG